MLNKISYIILVFLFLNSVKAEEAQDNKDLGLPKEEDYVFVLDSKNFDQFIKNNELTVVFFYAPWCGHCTNMKPHYHEAAKLLRVDESIKTDKPVVLAKVDATIERDLAEKYEIKGYPTIKIFRKGAEYDYQGPRSEGKDIVSYLQKEASNDWKEPVVTVEDNVYVLGAHTFKKFTKENPLSVVFLYAPWCGHCTNMKPHYHEAARLLKEDDEFKTDKPIVLIKIDATQEESLASQFKVQGYPTIKILRNGQEYEYEGPRSDGKAIAKYLQKEASNDWKPPESKVAVLGLGNFTEWVEKYEVSLVEFYSPNCGHCVALAPNYEKAAKILLDDPNPVPLAKVDATVEHELSKKYEINGFPTLYIFRKGRHYEYKGGREVQEIVSTMRKARQPATKEVKTLKELNVHVKSPTEVYVLGVFESKNDDLFQTYHDFASDYPEDLKLFYTFNRDEFAKSLKSDKIKSPSILVIYHDLAVPKNEPKFRVLDSAATVKDIEEFVFKNSLPIIGFVSPKNRLLIFDKIKPICYLMFDVDVELKSHIISIRDKFLPVARKFKQIRFVMANETENNELKDTIHFDKIEGETNLVCVNEKSKVFLFDEDSESLDSEEMLNFVKRFVDGKVKHYIKSEKEPKDNNKKLVKRVVGSTLESFIKTANKQIFISFNGPRMDNFDLEEHEKTLNALAKKFASNKNVLFGTFDISKNDLSDLFTVEKNKPSFYHVPSADKSNPVLLKDKQSLTLDDLVEFVEDSLKNVPKKQDKKTEL